MLSNDEQTILYYILQNKIRSFYHASMQPTTSPLSAICINAFLLSLICPFI